MVMQGVNKANTVFYEETGAVSTFAGVPGAYGSADGLGAAARFANPVAMATDAAGNAYVTDGNTVRKVTSAGVVTTLAP